MKIVFLSNYFNHHQKAFSDKMFEMLGNDYKFVETSKMSEERKRLGYGIELPTYVVDGTDQGNAEYLKSLVISADAVIIGGAPDSLIKERITDGKIIFRYSERPLKKGFGLLKYPIRFYRWHKQNPRKKTIYMLCASAYTAVDYSKFGLFKNRCYKWGYFPQLVRYNNIEQLINSKKKNSIIWVGRFIDWKHPELAIALAKHLKDRGYSFELNMIGNGVMLEDIKTLVDDQKLADYVNILGAMKPDEVRKYMEKSSIHIFTSDRQEGWGAVLNEAMNSACACVANRDIGSVPYLLDNGENGLIYDNNDELFKKVEFLLDNVSACQTIGKKAYYTVETLWNADVAAERFLTLAAELLKCDDIELFYDGPCSKQIV